MASVVESGWALPWCYLGVGPEAIFCGVVLLVSGSLDCAVGCGWGGDGFGFVEASAVSHLGAA